MFIESQNRIASMALIHEKLYQSPDLAYSLFRTHGVDPSRVQLNVETGELALGINDAVPCGLILNEIVSNSLKYAFPNDRKGNIRIALDPGADGRFNLTVGDDGIGLPADLETRAAKSLGMRLIERLADQLQGTVERNSSSAGTGYRISFPRNG